MSGAVAIALIAVGAAFLATSALGLLRLPGFYSRAHAVGKSETMGAVLVIAGVAVEHGLVSVTTPKLALILVFSVLANPTAVHALARAARLLEETEPQEEQR